MADPKHTFKVHHGGQFTDMPLGKMYLGGKVDFINDIDPDLMSYFEMVIIIKELGCAENAIMYHCLPDCDLDGGLRVINTDIAVRDMFAIHEGIGTIAIYVVDEYGKEDDDEGSESAGEGNAGSPRGSIGDSDIDYFADGDDLFESNGQVTTEVEVVDLEGYGVLSKGVRRGFGEGTHGFGEGTSRVGEGSSVHRLSSVEEVDVEDIDSPRHSDDGKKDDFPEFFEDRHMDDPDLQVGTMFASAAVFRAALRKHTILNGTDFEFKKNDGDRVTAICKNKCGWRIHASNFQGTAAFQIKSLKCHPCQCPRQYRLRHANSAWIARTYMDRLTDDPNWKVSAIRKAAKRDHMVEVSTSQAYRAKKRALERIEGNHRQQYWSLWDYCEMVRRSNHGSTALLKVERPFGATSPVFQRMFVMYEAQMRGFLSGCRPLIGLDACHLKGPFGGQLMSAIAKDANDQMYPVAMAVVEAETKDSWTWFLENLISIIGRPEEHGWTFISDRQKVYRHFFFKFL